MFQFLQGYKNVPSEVRKNAIIGILEKEKKNGGGEDMLYEAKWKHQSAYGQIGCR